MKKVFRRSLAAGMLVALTVAISLHGQEIKLGNQAVQVHGFGTQGLIYTNDNNWLTMNTSAGSVKFTDVGLNLGSQISRKVRAAAQGYDRSLGQLGKWHPQFDFYMLDVRPKPWLGFRGGKVKTVLGLYTDTQDMDFDHTFALLPQSIYPIDMRDSSIAHVGGDIYGTERLAHNLGSLTYTAYGGHRSDSKYSGYPYLLTNIAPGVHIYLTSYSGPVYGGDLRWNTPVPGLTVGVSRQNEDISGVGTLSIPAAGVSGVPYNEKSFQDWTNWFYGKYTKNRLHIEAEDKRYYQAKDIFSSTAWFYADTRGWYVSGGFRINKWLEAGSYYSHYRIFIGGADLVANGPALNFNYTDPQKRDNDKVVTAKITFNQYVTLKVEGHFMAGNGLATYPDGFYTSVNPLGLADNTNALIVRTGFNF
jgi:hypothetical protein